MSGKYDFGFIPDKTKLPDPQLTHIAEGAAHAKIQKVGINHYDCPIDFTMRDGKTIKLKGTFSGYVSLKPNVKGINMSRIAILINEVASSGMVGVNVLNAATEEMLSRLESDMAYIKVKFDFPMKLNSLRSKDDNGKPLEGWSYYPCMLEITKVRDSNTKAYLTTTFTYSSACPCSYELAKNALETRNAEAISHSQRSKATTTIEFDSNKEYFVEDLIELHRQVLMTECQIVVKREDEQAFAEMNGAYPKFVEDATRLMFEALDKDNKILDFVTVCVHKESLHPHNAIGVIYKGTPGGLR
jgi:GTP cyclohydrolase I